MLYWLTRQFLRLYFGVAVEIRVEGLEHVPDRGGGIIVANHRCALDGFLVMRLLPRRAYFFTATSNFRNPVTGWYLRGIGQRPVTPGTDNRTSMAWAIDLLRRGELFGLAPEGVVQPAGRPSPFQPGFMWLAMKTAVPVLPIAIVGSERVLSEPRNPVRPSHYVPRRAAVDVAFLPPMRFEARDGDREHFERCRRQVEDTVAERVAELMRRRGEA